MKNSAENTAKPAMKRTLRFVVLAWITLLGLLLILMLQAQSLVESGHQSVATIRHAFWSLLLGTVVFSGLVLWQSRRKPVSHPSRSD